MKYNLIYKKKKLLVVLKKNNKIIEILGINKYLYNNKIQYLFINKNRLQFWLIKGINISIRVSHLCNLYYLKNVRN
jgi:ribosomal protein S16